MVVEVRESFSHCALTEIVAMVVATITALILVLGVDDSTMATQVLDGFAAKLLLATLITTVTWITTAFVTAPEKYETLKSFCDLTNPGGPGWKKIVDEARKRGDDSLYEKVEALGRPSGNVECCPGHFRDLQRSVFDWKLCIWKFATGNRAYALLCRSNFLDNKTVVEVANGLNSRGIK